MNNSKKVLIWGISIGGGVVLAYFGFRYLQAVTIAMFLKKPMGLLRNTRAPIFCFPEIKSHGSRSKVNSSLRVDGADVGVVQRRGGLGLTRRNRSNAWRSCATSSGKNLRAPKRSMRISWAL